MERGELAEHSLDIKQVERPKIGSIYNAVFNEKGLASVRIEGKQAFRLRAIAEWKPRPGYSFSVELTACKQNGDRRNFFGEWECVPSGEKYPSGQNYIESPKI